MTKEDLKKQYEQETGKKAHISHHNSDYVEWLEKRIIGATVYFKIEGNTLLTVLKNMENPTDTVLVIPKSVIGHKNITF